MKGRHLTELTLLLVVVILLGCFFLVIVGRSPALAQTPDESNDSYPSVVDSSVSSADSIAADVTTGHYFSCARTNSGAMK